jgi:hypothetical protein
MTSLLDIVTHTPVAVWAGLAAWCCWACARRARRRCPPHASGSCPRSWARRRWPARWRVRRRRSELLTGACWAVGAALGFVSNRSLDLPRRVSANADGSFTVGGSIAPLLLFVGVFMVRYVVNVALAIQPSLAHDPVAAAAAAIAYGFTTGLLAARSRKIWATRRDRGTLLAA